MCSELSAGKTEEMWKLAMSKLAWPKVSIKGETQLKVPHYATSLALYFVSCLWEPVPNDITKNLSYCIVSTFKLAYGPSWEILFVTSILATSVWITKFTLDFFFHLSDSFESYCWDFTLNFIWNIRLCMYRVICCDIIIY